MRHKTMDVVLNEISTKYKIDGELLFFPYQPNHVKEIRSIFYYCCRKLRVPIVEIQRYNLLKDFHCVYGTLHYGIGRIANKIKEDKVLRAEVNAIIAECTKILTYGELQ